MDIERHSQIDKDRSQFGGKAAHLLWLESIGAPVPAFFPISISDVSLIAKNKSVDSSLLNGLNFFVEQNKPEKFAVRSSMGMEDGHEVSFAGMGDTLLNLKSEEVWEAINKLANEIDSPRLIAYRQQKNITTETQLGLVVQIMAKATVSGVVFSRSPQGNSAHIIIEAVAGLGDKLVSGQANSDHYRMLRTGEIVQYLPQSPHSKELLSIGQIKELLNWALKLEKELGCPIDLEYSFVGDALYILQVRPITQEFAPLLFYVDTNLAESYPGYTSKLCSEFVKKGYTKVFEEALSYLEVPKYKQELMRPYLKNLIGNAGGHLYYNLENYYALLSCLPGGDKNIDAWHAMIGGKGEGLTPPRHPELALNRWESLKAIFKIFWLAITHPIVFKKFHSLAQTMRQELNAKLAKTSGPKEILWLLKSEIKIMEGFGLTILNDLLIMLCLRPLRKWTKSDSEFAGILKTGQTLDSLSPFLELEKIKPMLAINKQVAIELKKWANSFSPTGKEAWAEIVSICRLHGNSQLATALQDYGHHFGSRSFEELKLESLPFTYDPRPFIELLLAAPINNQQHKQPPPLKLQGVGPKILLYFLRRFIITRESTRLVRGQFYQWARECLLKCYVQLKHNSERFSNLTLDNFFDLTIDEIIELIDQADKKIPPRTHNNQQQSYPEFLILEAGKEDEIVYSPLLDFADNSINKNSLQGLPAASGKVRAQAIVVFRPQDVLSTDSIEGKILITPSTDPAWVFLMARAKGLISERGSLLSHTAIIGRELGVPTVVNVREATQHIKSGMIIELDGNTGRIEICQ